EVIKMGESAKRINLTLSKEKYDLLKELAEKQDTSMASLVEDFMDVGMELFEDIGLAEIAGERLEEEPDEWLTLDEL
ncbi:MAG: hypothetical protein ACQEP7_03420, partial [bacterium]